VLIIRIIPVLGWIVAYVLGVVLTIVSLIGLIYALQGKFWKIPIVYDFAKGFKF